MNITFDLDDIDALADAVAERVAAKLAAVQPSAKPDEKVWLTTKQAAEYIGVSTQHLEGLRCKGGGPRYYKPNGARVIRYKYADLDAWLAERGHTSEKKA